MIQTCLKIQSRQKKKKRWGDKRVESNLVSGARLLDSDQEDSSLAEAGEEFPRSQGPFFLRKGGEKGGGGTLKLDLWLSANTGHFRRIVVVVVTRRGGPPLRIP